MKLFLTALIFLVLNNAFAQLENKLVNAEMTFQSGDFDRAIELFSEIIELESSEYLFDAYYGRAYCYYEKKEYEKAESDVKKSLKINAGHHNFELVKGNSYWLYSSIISWETCSVKSLKLLKKASKYLQSSLLFSTIGFEEIYLERYDDAIKSLNTSLELDVNNAWAFNNRALAYLKLNKLDMARADVNKSIELDSENPFAFKHSALIYIALGDMDSACQDLKKAMDMETTNRMNEFGLKEIEVLMEEYCEK